MSFRLNWTIKQFTNLKGYSANKKILISPWKFYLSLLIKFIPKLHRKSISFSFKNGSVINIREFMSIYIYNEIFVDGCYDNLPVKRNNPLVIEVGANTGFFVLRIKTTYPDSEIISFEPYPPNFNALLETIELNNLENVKPINMAVADKPGRLKLFIHPTNIGGHSIFLDNASENYVEVETTTIESILSDNNISVCDLLKLDCEGAEYPILKSFTKEIATKIRNIIYEPTYSQYSVEELNLYLKELGYNIKGQHGLIVASMEKI
ncbi:MAG: FkbM family methyltransferase [Deltaproteobacteria bacterium]|nr:FkbM family methyltransferase [Deltaproteobacteria bacterium]